MRIKCWWYESEECSDGVFRPICACVEEEEKFKGLIFSFLNDDEGLGLDYLIDWLEVGLIEIDKIKEGALDFYDMWGQAWGADITSDNVIIYWGYDDTDYKEGMSFNVFYKIFVEWLSFIKKEASIESKFEFEC